MRFSLHRKKQTSNGAWVVAADMGYGHYRAALPLQKIAFRRTLINANDYPGIPFSDKLIWHESRRLYEVISRFKKFPILGDFVFGIFDKFQAIQEFYPREQSIDSPTLQLKQVYALMEKRKWGKHLIQKLNQNPLPFVTTFFVLASMAEYWGYSGPVYLIIPDTDVSRAWAPLRPSQSKIRYCVPTQRVAERLKRYGVEEQNIFYTGFPLPEEFTSSNAFRAKQDLKRRLTRLDPNCKYRMSYSKIIKQYVGALPTVKLKPRPFSITFAIGGAGVQEEIAEKIMESVSPLLKTKRIVCTVIAGMDTRITASLHHNAKEHGVSSFLGKNLFIRSALHKKEYFKEFARILHATDILWTKPSELVFYAGLGIPLLIAPPVGSQEVCNRRWLLKIGAGIDQMNPAFTHQWLPDLIEEGVFAEAALQGFIKIEKRGTENIAALINSYIPTFVPSSPKDSEGHSKTTAGKRTNS